MNRSESYAQQISDDIRYMAPWAETRVKPGDDLSRIEINPQPGADPLIALDIDEDGFIFYGVASGCIHEVMEEEEFENLQHIFTMRGGSLFGWPTLEEFLLERYGAACKWIIEDECGHLGVTATEFFKAMHDSREKCSKLDKFTGDEQRNLTNEWIDSVAGEDGVGYLTRHLSAFLKKIRDMLLEDDPTWDIVSNLFVTPPKTGKNDSSVLWEIEVTPAWVDFNRTEKDLLPDVPHLTVITRKKEPNKFSIRYNVAGLEAQLNRIMYEISLAAAIETVRPLTEKEQTELDEHLEVKPTLIDALDLDEEQIEAQKAHADKRAQDQLERLIRMGAVEPEEAPVENEENPYLHWLEDEDKPYRQADFAAFHAGIESLKAEGKFKTSALNEIFIDWLSFKMRSENAPFFDEMISRFLWALCEHVEHKTGEWWSYITDMTMTPIKSGSKQSGWRLEALPEDLNFYTTEKELLKTGGVHFIKLGLGMNTPKKNKPHMLDIFFSLDDQEAKLSRILIDLSKGYALRRERELTEEEFEHLYRVLKAKNSALARCRWDESRLKAERVAAVHAAREAIAALDKPLADHSMREIVSHNYSGFVSLKENNHD